MKLTRLVLSFLLLGTLWPSVCASDSKLSELSAKTPAAGSYLYIVNDPTGTPASGYVTVQSLFEMDLSAFTLTVGDLNLGADADFGDYDVTSVDKLEGYDANVYVDLGADGYLDLEADTAIRILGPTTVEDAQTVTFDESAADPNDCDIALSAADGVFKISGVNGANNESLTIDVDSAANTATIGTDSGVTSVSFGSLALVTTGAITGAINIVEDSDGRSITASEAYGTLHVATGAGTWTLPDVCDSATGANICLYSTGGNNVVLDCQAEDAFTYEGVTESDGEALDSDDNAGEFICVVCAQANEWHVLGHTAGWTGE